MKVRQARGAGGHRPGPSGISLAADTQPLTASQVCGAGRGLGPHRAHGP